VIDMPVEARPLETADEINPKYDPGGAVGKLEVLNLGITRRICRTQKRTFWPFKNGTPMANSFFPADIRS